MKSVLFALCLIATNVFADNFSPEQYNLPNFSQSWTVGNKIEHDKGTTLIFFPKGADRQSAKEFFGVNINNKAGDINDTSAFKRGLSQMFPKMQIDLWEIEKNNNSIFYEWSGKANGQEKVHGWGRAFATRDGGSVVLGYLTENVSDIPRARADWVPVLKNAKAP